MIKIILIVFVMTTNGPIKEVVGEFPQKDGRFCEAVGAELVKRLKRDPRITAVTYRCEEITEV